VIDYLKGRVAHWQDGFMVVVPGEGLGVQVVIPASLHYDVDDKVMVYTHLSLVSSNNGSSFIPTLYGFRSIRERDLFLLLQTVNGVGAKAAMRVMALGGEEIVSAIEDGEHARLKVKSVGPKLTKRIVDDLRNKIAVLV